MNNCETFMSDKDQGQYISDYDYTGYSKIILAEQLLLIYHLQFVLFL